MKLGRRIKLVAEAISPRALYRAVGKIRKIIQYIPVLWRDEDWDWHYIVILLRYKLERTSKCIQTNEIIIEEERDLIEKQIGVVTKLLSRVEKDEYGDWLERNIAVKYGDNFLAYLPKDSVMYELMHGNGPDDYETRFTEDERNDIQEMWRQSYRAAARMKQRDIERSFKVMGKHLQWWWD